MFVRGIKAIGEKFARVVAQRGPDYQAGIENPRRDQATAAAAAEPLFEAGIQAAIAEKRFGKGVRKAGSEKWKRGAREKGVARWPVGVAAAQPDFEAGFGPYRDALERTELPPRRAKRDPANLQRVQKVVETMIATARAGAGK